MAKILIPQKQSMSNSLPMAGSVVGGAVGGYFSGGSPQGIMGGAQLGGGIGGMAQGMVRSVGLDKAPPEAVQTNQHSASPEDNAMSRRMQQLEQDPVYNIRQAKSALGSLPPEQQQEYAPALDEAYRRAVKQRQQGVA
jgi:hypothetical protein